MTVSNAPPGDHDVAGLLASPAFARSRQEAPAIADSPQLLRTLMHQVEHAGFAGWDLSQPRTRLHVDIACAVLEARIEELETRESQPLLPVAAQHSATIASVRLHLFVAVLHYFATPHDAIPDHTLLGHVDDLTLLRWVVDVAQRELPATD